MKIPFGVQVAIIACAMLPIMIFWTAVKDGFVAKSPTMVGPPSYDFIVFIAIYAVCGGVVLAWLWFWDKE